MSIVALISVVEHAQSRGVVDGFDHRDKDRQYAFKFESGGRAGMSPPVGELCRRNKTRAPYPERVF
jgi:hypothetical protein